MCFCVIVFIVKQFNYFQQSLISRSLQKQTVVKHTLALFIQLSNFILNNFLIFLGYRTNFYFSLNIKSLSLKRSYFYLFWDDTFRAGPQKLK